MTYNEFKAKITEKLKEYEQLHCTFKVRGRVGNYGQIKSVSLKRGDQLFKKSYYGKLTAADGYTL